MRHKVNINCTLWVYCSNNITRLYWPFQPARESFIYGIFALCKVCGSKRLIIESLAPKKIILFLEQRLMFCKMMLRHKWLLSHQIHSFFIHKNTRRWPGWSLFWRISGHLKSGHVPVRSTWLRPGLSACKDLRSEQRERSECSFMRRNESTVTKCRADTFPRNTSIESESVSLRDGMPAWFLIPTELWPALAGITQTLVIDIKIRFRVNMRPMSSDLWL